jgi:hypothetical protein
MRRLLFAALNGAQFNTGATPVTMTGCIINRLSNHVVSTNVVFPFGQALYDSTGGSMWTAGSPSKIVIPAGVGNSKLWVIGADITTLGTSYGGTGNQRVILEIVKNWPGNEAVNPHLNYEVAGERFWNENAASAYLNSISFHPVLLNEGDELELLVTGSGSDLLVESNPSDGVPSGYLTDDGPGTLSPRFYAFLWPGQ